MAHATGDIGKFSIVPEWIIFHPELSPQAVRLFAVIARYVDLPKGSIPSRKVIAERMGISVDTLDRAKQELIDASALKVEYRKVKGVQQTNRYHLKFVAPEKAASAPPPGRTSAARSPGRTDAALKENEKNEPPPSASPQSSASAKELVAFYVDTQRKMGGKAEKRTTGAMAQAIGQLCEQGFTDEEIRAAIGVHFAKGTSPSLLGQHAAEASRKASPNTEHAAAERRGEQNPRIEATQRRLAEDDEYRRNAVTLAEAGINVNEIFGRDQ